jgi:catechol 2,3-dioxygenase-like lactoylglutathione lyase family enzyme
MISGVHALIFSRDADADRAFFRDVLGFNFVDSGGGWLIFALPPAEVGIHPAEANGEHQLFLLCDDIDATAKDLELRGVTLKRPFHEEAWGRLSSIKLPGGGELGIYQAKHALTHDQAATTG